MKAQTTHLPAEDGAFRASKKTEKTQKGAALPTLGFLLLLFIAVQTALPLGSALQIGADEGFELSKATLQLHGFKLYSDVWNDQPPLHTFMVTGILRNITHSVLGPRLLTVAMAAVFLCGLFGMSNRCNGVAVAAIATGFTILAPGFLELSASCMLEIPCLAASYWAIAALFFFPATRMTSGIVCGSLFAVALLIKLVAAIIAPVIVFCIFILEWNGRSAKNRSRSSRQIVLSSCKTIGMVAISSAAVFTLVEYLIDGGAFIKNFHQTWESHFAGGKSFEYGSAGEHVFDWAIFLRHWDTTIPALIGITSSVRTFRSSPLNAIPTVWLALMVLVFAFHTPWWPYYYVHISPPLCWLGAIGLTNVWRWANQHGQKGLRPTFVAFACCATLWAGSRGYLEVSHVRKLPTISEALVLEDIRVFKDQVKFMFSDELVYSFYSDIPMPPKLAVLPLKRLWSGEMTNAKMATELAGTRPGLLLLNNDSQERPFTDLVASEYQLIFEDQRFRLLVRRDLAQTNQKLLLQ